MCGTTSPEQKGRTREPEEKGRRGEGKKGRNLKIQLAVLLDYYQSNGTKISLRIHNTVLNF